MNNFLNHFPVLRVQYVLDKYPVFMGLLHNVCLIEYYLIYEWVFFSLIPNKEWNIYLTHQFIMPCLNESTNLLTDLTGRLQAVVPVWDTRGQRCETELNVIHDMKTTRKNRKQEDEEGSWWWHIVGRPILKEQNITV